MEKERKKKVCKTKAEGEFRACPECGYENGFHCMFVPSGEEGVLNWYLICPGCSSRYDISLKARVG